jgi:hypothetical protein
VFAEALAAGDRDANTSGADYNDNLRFHLHDSSSEPFLSSPD